MLALLWTTIVQIGKDYIIRLYYDHQPSTISASVRSQLLLFGTVISQYYVLCWFYSLRFRSEFFCLSMRSAEAINQPSKTYIIVIDWSCDEKNWKHFSKLSKNKGCDSLKNRSDMWYIFWSVNVISNLLYAFKASLLVRPHNLETRSSLETSMPCLTWYWLDNH